MRAFVIFGLLCCLVLGSQGEIECPRVKTRMQWGADEPSSSYNLNSKPSLVLVKETGKYCKNRALCSAEVKKVQNYDMLVSKLPDVNCNFLIGSDGQVYTGRGWEHGVYSKSSIVICMLGSYDTKAPADELSSTLKTFLTCSFEEDKLSPYYKVKAWKDVNTGSDNPGKSLYKVIQKLPQYSAPPAVPNVN